jgi:cbb3-type cytochrome oxidase subunit 3
MNMDTNLLRALVTLCGLCLFIALVVWAWLPARQAQHAQAAQLPFLGDDSSPTTQPLHKHRGAR